jgi:ABC-2 type transport system ATP-binding protein
LNENVIEVENLVKVYGNLKAVDGISFKAFHGEILALLGPNGAGKTTTIEILQTLRNPTSGNIKVLGYDVTTSSGAEKVKKRIGVLPQDFNALDRLSVYENIALFAGMYDSHKNPTELIQLLDLTDKTNVKFKHLSGGLKQRVGIAAALVNDPELVFLDEPTTGLDPRSRRDVWQVIQNLKKSGKTVILTTHYMEEAQVLADRIAIINKGKIVAEDSPHVLLEKYGGKKTVVIEETSSELALKFREQFPTADVFGSTISIEAEDASEIATILEFLAKMGHERDITIKNPSIEDVFLRMIGSKITEEGELA